jgi:hypothetical protein
MWEEKCNKTDGEEGVDLIDISSNCTEKCRSCQLVNINKFEEEEEERKSCVCLFVCFLWTNKQINTNKNKYMNEWIFSIYKGCDTIRKSESQPWSKSSPRAELVPVLLAWSASKIQFNEKPERKQRNDILRIKASHNLKHQHTLKQTNKQTNKQHNTAQRRGCVKVWVIEWMRVTCLPSTLSNVW